MKHHQKSDWIKYFPFVSPRNEQEVAINFILDQFISHNKKYVCADLGTGLGKSAIAVTVARYMNADTYILTTQKVLQDQYVNDFCKPPQRLLCSLKSSSNYNCSFYTDQSCGDSRRLLTSLGEELQDTDFAKNCKWNCVYQGEKQAFLAAKLGITNFSYFLAETMYSGKLEPRQLLVVDESHNIEKQCSQSIAISFSEKFAKNSLGIKFPKLKTQAEIVKWLQKKYIIALRKHISSIQNVLKQCFHAGNKEDDIKKFSQQYTYLDKHLCKINRFFEKYDESNWVVTFTESLKTKSKKFEFKPVDVSSFTRDALFCFGEKILMMSATIINKEAFCRSVGLSPNNVAFINIPSPFSVENRKVHALPVGSMSYKNIDETLPLMAKAVEMLLEQHEHEKGLIHATSYKIANYLYSNIKSDRLLTHTSENREEILSLHKLSKEPTVLISPSMAEGIDLSDDSGRFQLLCKIPFPPLNDELVKKRMQKDSQWYPYETVKTIIQSLGRSIRNEDDYAVSYILDADWEYFLKRNKTLFSLDFLSTLK